MLFSAAGWSGNSMLVLLSLPQSVSVLKGAGSPWKHPSSYLYSPPLRLGPGNGSQNTMSTSMFTPPHCIHMLLTAGSPSIGCQEGKAGVGCAEWEMNTLRMGDD